MSNVAGRDLREGGRWTGLQRAKNDAIYVAAATSLALAVRLPAPWLRTLGRSLGRLAHVAAPALRRLARANVARAFPDLGDADRDALVSRAYVRLGEHLGEAVASLAPSRAAAPLALAEGAREALDEALAEGRGVLFASAHLGPWERVAETLTAAGLPFTAVAREAYDPRLDAIYARLRAGRGVRTIYRGRAGAAAAMLRTLRSGGILGIPMDLASRVPSVEVPFLGVPAPTPVGPARLALRVGAAVVVGTAAPGPDGPVLVAARIPTRDLAGRGKDEAAAHELTARLAAARYDPIRAMPAAWPWMHPRWGSRPV